MSPCLVGNATAAAAVADDDCEDNDNADEKKENDDDNKNKSKDADDDSDSATNKYSLRSILYQTITKTSCEQHHKSTRSNTMPQLHIRSGSLCLGVHAHEDYRPLVDRPSRQGNHATSPHS